MQAFAALAALMTTIVTFIGGWFQPAVEILEDDIVIEIEEKIVDQTPVSTREDRDNLCFEEHCFQIEKAVTEGERARGLMHRESLDADKGMLFVFEQPGKFGFRMKNTLIPLDIIRLDKNLKIVDIRAADPCTQDPCPSYGPNDPADYVLEINQGLAESYGIQKGSQLEGN